MNAQLQVSEGNCNDSSYHDFVNRLTTRLLSNTNNGKEPVFATDVSNDDIWNAYLSSFSDKQYHNCSTCRHFLYKYGSLVVVNDDGSIKSAIWDEEDSDLDHKKAVQSIIKLLKKAKITGPFLSSEKVWGEYQTGIWSHMAITPPASMVFKQAFLSAKQTMAEKKEDYRNVQRALSEYKVEDLERAVAYLEADALYRSEKVLGQATWLRDLSLIRGKGQRSSNLIWKAVAKAPAGFCHPRSSMIGTLLDDISAGLSFEDAAAKFKAKMHPLQYQRPTAAPTSGAIAQAEKLFESMGLAPSLERRFAKPEEIQSIWKETVKKVNEGGIFSHLKEVSKSDKDVIPGGKITWVKFVDTVLPNAESIEAFADYKDDFMVFTTCTNEDALPLLQWDSVENRNPVAWYFWHGGRSPSQFRLKSGWNPVSAVTLKPSMWNGKNQHQGKCGVFLLKGARETVNTSLCLFPETIRSELHGVRSVIEAHSRSRKLLDIDGEHAVGLTAGEKGIQRVRVSSGNKTIEYSIDRWD